MLLQIQHYDRASLLAGKLHALLQRPYTKGRDLYDLMWYKSDPTWPEPNLVLLNNALQQTGWSGGVLTTENWRSIVAAQLRGLEWDRVLSDVRPLIETGAMMHLLTLDNLLHLLNVPPDVASPPVTNG